MFLIPSMETSISNRPVFKSITGIYECIVAALWLLGGFVCLFSNELS